MPDEQADRNDARRKGGKELEKEAPKLTKKTRLESTPAMRQPCGQYSNELDSVALIEDKLNLLLTALPELKNYKSRINQLEV